MKRIQLFNDNRENAVSKRNWCIHCLGDNHEIDPKTDRLLVKRTNDHVPSKCLLAKPYPLDLPTVKICAVCNLSFAPHEEYFAAFLGTVSENEHLSEKSMTILDSNNKLSNALIDSLLVEEGEPRIAVNFDQNHIDIVLEKNARGHFYFETQDVIGSKCDFIRMSPIKAFSTKQRSNFEKVTLSELFPEVGTRAFIRQIENRDVLNGWVIVQNNQYRYAIILWNNEVLVRSVISEEFAVEVFWKNAFPD